MPGFAARWLCTAAILLTGAGLWDDPRAPGAVFGQRASTDSRPAGGPPTGFIPAVTTLQYLPYAVRYYATSKPVGTFGADPPEFAGLAAAYDMNITLSTLGAVDKTLNGLADARAAGFKVIGALNADPPRDDQGRFSMTEFKAIVDSYAVRINDLAPYIADRTFYAHILFDEPCDAPYWGGVAITRDQILEAANHSRLKLPGLPVSVGTGSVSCMSTLLPGDVDIPLAPYTILKGTIQTYIADNVAALETNGWVEPRLLVSINVFNGFPAGQLMAAADVTSNAVYACGHPNVVSVLWWEWHGPQSPDFATIVAGSVAYQDALRAGTAACW